MYCPSTGNLSIVGVSFSGRVPTWGTPVSLLSTAYSQPYVLAGIIKLGDNKGAIAYTDRNPSSPFQANQYIRAFTISGNTLTVGAQVTIDTSTSGTFRFIEKVNTDTFCVGIKVPAASPANAVYGCSVSGTTVTAGTPDRSGGYSNTFSGAVFVEAGKFVINWGTTDSGTGWQVFTQSGTTLTAGTASTTSSSTNVVVNGHAYSNTQVYMNGRALTLSGTTITGVATTNPWMGGLPQNGSNFGQADQYFESPTSGVFFGYFNGMAQMGRQLANEAVTSPTTNVMLSLGWGGDTSVTWKSSNKFGNTTMILWGRYETTNNLAVTFVDLL